VVNGLDDTTKTILISALGLIAIGVACYLRPKLCYVGYVYSESQRNKPAKNNINDIDSIDENKRLEDNPSRTERMYSE
jgi:hypothetical protein